MKKRLKSSECLRFPHDGSPKERADATKAIRKKYRDIIEWPHVEGDGLHHTLYQLAKSGDAESARALADLARSSLQGLRMLAETGDHKSAEALVELLTDEVFKMNQATHKSLFLAFLPQVQTAWPTLVYRKKRDRDRAIERVLDGLKLGEEVPIKLTGKPATSIEHNIASRLFEMVWERRREYYTGEIPDAAKRLPEWSKKTAPLWWKVAEAILIDWLGEDFENHKYCKEWAKLKALRYEGIKPHERISRIRREFKFEIRKDFVLLPSR
jgi:hypothetical protein